MSLKRWAAKRDSNEAEIIAVFRQYGWLVQQVSAPGFCDLILRHPQHGFLLVEVKSGKGKLRPLQVKHKDDGWPIVVIRSVAAAIPCARGEA